MMCSYTRYNNFLKFLLTSNDMHPCKTLPATFKSFDLRLFSLGTHLGDNSYGCQTFFCLPLLPGVTYISSLIYYFLEEFVYSNIDFKSKPMEFMSRDEKYTEGIRRTTLAVARKDELDNLIQNPRDLAFFNK